MKSKPKNAAGKRNHAKIRSLVRQPILKALVKPHHGGALLLLDDLQIAELADLMTSGVMNDENFSISVKRSK